jgi:CTP synthase
VGDIEGLPFLEALRQMRKDAGRDNTLYIHVTLLPHIGATGELKTKPTQHSVRELRSIGIQPDVIVCRADYPVADSLRDKIALFCDVEAQAVIPLKTVRPDDLRSAVDIGGVWARRVCGRAAEPDVPAA